MLNGIVTLFLGLLILIGISLKNRDVAPTILAGFFCRVGVALFTAYVYPIPNMEDGVWWHYAAVINSKQGVMASFEYFKTGHTLYIWLMTFLYALFGPSKLMIQGINVFFGTLIIYNVYKLSLVIWHRPKAALRASWIVALFPGLIMYSSLVLREVAVAYPLSLGVLYFARYFRERHFYLLVLAVLSFLVSMAFHTGVAAVFLAGGLWFGAKWLKDFITGQHQYFQRNSIILIGILGVFAFLFFSGFGSEKYASMDNPSVNEIDKVQDNYTRGRTYYLEDMRADSWTDFSWQWPIRLLYFLFAPFPWMLRGMQDIFALLDSFLLFYMALQIVIKKNLFAKNKNALVVLALFSTLSLVFALGVSNYGTAMRHRDKMVPILVAVAVALPRRIRRKITFSSYPAHQSLLNQKI
jgi:hypothetical protein